jgi:uncharacterized membrane protein
MIYLITAYILYLSARSYPIHTVIGIIIGYAMAYDMNKTGGIPVDAEVVVQSTDFFICSAIFSLTMISLFTRLGWSIIIGLAIWKKLG